MLGETILHLFLLDFGKMFITTISHAHCFLMCFEMKNDVKFYYACYAHVQVLVHKASYI
jgi:hypothetical protein